MPGFIRMGGTGSVLNDEIAGTQAGINALRLEQSNVIQEGGDGSQYDAAIARQEAYLDTLRQQRASQNPVANVDRNYAPDYAAGNTPPPTVNVDPIPGFLTAGANLASNILAASKGAQNTATQISETAKWGAIGAVALAIAWIVTRKK